MQRTTKTIFNTSCLLLTAVSMLHCGRQTPKSSLDSIPQYIRIADSAPNILPGVGYDSLRERARGHCIESKEELRSLPGTNEGKKVDFVFEQITSTEKLMSKLGISTGASLNFIVGGGSAKFDILTGHSSSDDSLTMLISSRVVNSEKTMGPVSLKPEYVDLYNKNPFSFYQTCGDSYISGLRTGGELYAVLEYHGLTREEKSKIEAGMKANYLFVSANGQMTAETESALSHAKLKIRIVQSGGAVSTGSTLEAFKKAAVEFASSVSADTTAGNSMPIEASLQDYESLNTGNADTTEFAALQAKRSIIRSLVGWFNYYQDLRQTAEHTMKNADKFEAFDEATLKGLVDRSTEHLVKITDAADTCLNNIKDCALPGEMVKETVKLPKLKALPPPPPPQVLSVSLFSHTTNENKDINKVYSAYLYDDQGNLVASAERVSNGIEYPERTDHEIPLNVVRPQASSSGLYKLLVNAEHGNDWNAQFIVKVTVRDGDVVKDLQTPLTEEMRFRPNMHRGGGACDFKKNVIPK